MLTPNKKRKLKKAIEKMNPTPEQTKVLRNHYEIYTMRWMMMGAMMVAIGFLFLGLYIYWIFDPSVLTIAFERGWVLCVSSICWLVISLPLLLVARHNDNAKRKVR